MAYDIGAVIGVEGEKEFRDSIKAINETMKTLGTEMKSVTSQFDKNDNSVEALTAKNDVLNKQIDMQKQKLAELAKGLEASTEKYGASDKVTQSWQRSVNEATAQLNNMERELKQNNDTIEKAASSTDDLNQEVKDIAENTENAGTKTDEFGQKLRANLTSAAVIAGVVALGKAVKEVAQGTADLAKGAASYADDILTLSTQTGIATDTLQELKYMEELTDVSMETVTKTMARNIRAMYNAQKGTKDYTDAYAKLKVDAIDPTTGALRDSETVYWEMIDALGRMENDTEADALAMTLLGRSAQELNPVIAIGSKGIKEYADEARSMGAVMSGEALDALGEVDDKLQRANQTMEIAKRKIGAELAPAFASATEKIANKVSDMDDEFASFAGGGLDLVVGGLEFIIDNRKPIIAGLAGITAGIVAFKVGSAGVAVASSAMSLFSKTTKTAATAQTTLNAAQAASPMGLIATAIGLAASGLTLYALNAKEASAEADNFNKKTEQTIDKIKGGIKAREDETNAIKIENGAAQKLSSELYNLSEKASLSNEEKAKMVALVSELNKSMPELQLSINGESGALSKQRGEVNKLIEANLTLYKVKAAQNSLNDIAKNQLEADNTVRDLEKKVAEKKVEMEEFRKKALSDGYMFWGEVNKAKQHEKELKQLETNLNSAKTTVKDLGNEWKEAIDYISDNSDILTSTEQIGDAMTGAANKYKEATGQMGYYMYELRDKIGSLKNEYADALEDKANEIKRSLGLFDGVEFNTMYTVDVDGNVVKTEKDLIESGDKLKTNLQNQVAYMEQYSKDMETLSGRKISKGLLDELRSMGLGAANEINALNNLTDEELSDYDKLWQEKSQLATQLASQELEQLKVNTDTQLEELEDIYYQRGQGAANSYIKGLHDIVDNEKLAIRAEMQGLLDADTAAKGYDSNYSFFGPVQKGTTGDNTSWMDNLKAVVENIMKNYSPAIVMDGEKVGELTSNRMAREMYTK